VKVDVHDRLDAVGEAAWSELHARTKLRSPFLTWIWQHQWAEVFTADHRLEIWRVREADELVALLPLYEADPGVLRILGGVEISDYLDLIAVAGREEAAWAALLEARAAAGTVWDLHAVPAASPTVTSLPTLAAAVGLETKVAVEERCPVLALPASWEAYLASLPGKHRHELTRKIRRLEREAPGTAPVCAATPETIADRLDEFLALHRSSRAGKARFMDARMETFFRRAVTLLAERGMARLWFLDATSGPMAAFITLEWNGTVGLYNSGFHPERAQLAPGLVLLAHLVRDAIERGKQRFDFLRGEERYKYEFGPTPEDVDTVRIA
jgi:CelD/BcsL family acetyltransferase involved in cellulose biosynthesis